MERYFVRIEEYKIFRICIIYWKTKYIYIYVIFSSRSIKYLGYALYIGRLSDTPYTQPIICHDCQLIYVLFCQPAQEHIGFAGPRAHKITQTISIIQSHNTSKSNNLSFNSMAQNWAQLCESAVLIPRNVKLVVQRLQGIETKRSFLIKLPLQTIKLNKLLLCLKPMI